MPYRVLLVDDERALREMVQNTLSAEGYTVLAAATCAEALALAGTARPDAVLLDVMLPDGDGFSLFERLRAIRDVPVLFLSARDEDEARLRGLGLGADDYIVKPFLPRELCLRLAAVLRRVYGQKQAPSLTLGSRTVDWGTGTVTGGPKPVTLTAKEYALLRKLWISRGNIVTIDALCEALWEGTLVGYENTLMVHIRRLREKIEDDPSHPRFLLTVRGLGYRLAPEEQP